MFSVVPDGVSAAVRRFRDRGRGAGCFDAVERQPRDGLPIEFAWSNTKDFWQQEQAILAYLIVHGITRDDTRIRAALALPEPTPVAEPTDYRERYALLIGQRIDLCPCCSGGPLPHDPIT